MILSTNTIYPLSGALEVGINFQMPAPTALVGAQISLFV